MKHGRPGLILALGVAVLAGACGSTNQTPASSTSSSGAPAASASPIFSGAIVLTSPHPQPPATTARGTPTPTATAITYVVQPGDSLANIAARFGVSIDAIVAANPGIDPNRMNVGQTLIIPPH